MVKGSLYKIKKKCGTKYCKQCAEGKYHEVYQFTYRNKNKVLTSTTVKEEDYPAVLEAWQNYKNIRKYELELDRKLKNLMDEIRANKNKNLVFIKDFKKSLEN